MVGQDVRTEVASVVEGIGRDITGWDGPVERKRDWGVYEGKHRENGRGARNSIPSTMVEIFIMVIALDFLGLSSGAREYFVLHCLCLEYKPIFTLLSMTKINLRQDFTQKGLGLVIT